MRDYSQVAVNLSNISLCSSNHFYPPNRHTLASDAKLVRSHSKACTCVLSPRSQYMLTMLADYVGEYDWTAKYTYYGLFACLIPLIFVIIAFCLPSRWFPWTFYLPTWLSFKRKRANTAPPVYSSLDEEDARKDSYAMTAPTTPISPGYNNSNNRTRVVIRKWMFALSFLLLVPIAAWIALEVGPTSLSSFLSHVESTDGVAGSAYWSLFGRDDDCCSWVDHVGAIFACSNGPSYTC